MNAVQEFTPAGRYVRSFGTWAIFGYGPGQFFSVSGVAVDRSGQVWVLDAEKSTLKVFSPSGIVLFQWDTAHNPKLALSHPSAIALDNANNIYVASGSRIVEIAALS